MSVGIGNRAIGSKSRLVGGRFCRSPRPPECEGGSRLTMAASIRHDRACKRLFSHPLAARDLLCEFVAEQSLGHGQHARQVGVNAFKGVGDLPRPVVETRLVGPAPDLARHEAQLPEVRVAVESPALHPTARRRAICDSRLTSRYGSAYGVVFMTEASRRPHFSTGSASAAMRAEPANAAKHRTLGEPTHSKTVQRFRLPHASSQRPSCRSSPPGPDASRFGVTRAGGRPVRPDRPFRRFLALLARPSHQLRPYRAAGPARITNECTVESVRRERGRIPCAD